MSPLHRALIMGNGTVSVIELPTQMPSRHEILVAPVYAGLCGTDIQILRGIRSDPSRIIGHEGVARIVAVGSDVPKRLAVGTLVCINPTHRNDPSFLLGHNVEGMFQERVLICGAAVRGGLVIPLSEIHNTAISTLLEPLAAVQYALSLLSEHCPQRLVIFGDGAVGHLAVRAAAVFLGPVIRIVHVHHTVEGMQWSKKHSLPAVECVMNDSTTVELLSSLPEHDSVAVLIATPRDATLMCLEKVLHNLRGKMTIDLLGGLPSNTSSAMLPGMDLSHIRGTNCAGSPTPAARFFSSTSEGKMVCLFGHRGVAHKHLRSAAAELALNPARYCPLVTHIVDLDEAAAVMRQLISSGDRSVSDRRLIKLAIHMAAEKSSPGGD